MEQRKIPRIDKDKVLFFQCDIQTGWKEVIYGWRQVLGCAKLVGELARLFKGGIPIITSEMYPGLLGDAPMELLLAQGPNVISLDREVFSMWTDEVEAVTTL